MKRFVFLQGLLAILLFLFFVPFRGCDKYPVKDKEIVVVFRMDDYCAKTNTDLEVKIFNSFKKKNAQITIGVIPFICEGETHDTSDQNLLPLPEYKAEILHEAYMDGSVDVAMHGFSHQRNKITLYDFPGEFAYLSKEVQSGILAKGKKFIQTIARVPVNLFVPPWNEYDSNTLKALEETGFSSISAVKSGPAHTNSKLNFFPWTVELHDLKGGVEIARNSPDKTSFLTVLFHEYDFPNREGEGGIISYDEFESLLDWCNNQSDIKIMSVGQALASYGGFGVNRFLDNNRLELNAGFLPPVDIDIDAAKFPQWITEKLPFKFKRLDKPQYPGPVLLKEIWLHASLFYLMIVSLALFFTFFIFNFLAKKITILTKIGTKISLGLLLIIILFVLNDFNLTLYETIGASAGTGFCLGLILSFLSFRNSAANK